MDDEVIGTEGDTEAISSFGQNADIKLPEALMLISKTVGALWRVLGSLGRYTPKYLCQLDVVEYE